MNILRELGGPSAAEREQIYARFGMSPRGIEEVERMIADSGLRPVGKSALTNVRVSLQSTKNQAARVVESHTCELVFAYELELDPDVLGYFVQVACRQISRTTSSGRTHVSSAHLDFLVFRKNGIELVECKTNAWLVHEASKPEAKWIKAGDCWRYAPYGDWAAQVGLTFRVWVAPELPGVYLQNLEACYALVGVELTVAEQLVIDRARRMLSRQPASIEELATAIPGFTTRQALWMLASRQAYGPLVSTPVVLADKFCLYTCEIQAREVDATALRAKAGLLADATIHDPLLKASTTDRNRAIKAYADLQEALAGKAPLTKRLKGLAKAVAAAVAEGFSPLVGCLTNFANSGNRSSRLLPEQEQAAAAALLAWNRGKVQLVRHLDYVFADECLKRGVAPIGKSRLDALRRAEDPRRHALATGGFRGFHRVRPSTDPRFRSLPPIGYGHVLYVDSSVFDLRYAAAHGDDIPPPKATFYVGIDGCTRMPMAHSLIFGPARTDGLALLLREYVKRHGFLPKIIHLDRGSENTSKWITEFCDGRITLRHSPTAGSAWNGIAESAIKQINGQVAHQLPGSTLPDQRGRSVDGRFKSINQARVAFATAHELFVQYLYEDLPRTPGQDGRCPVEVRDDAVQDIGVMGTPCEWNDDFLICTSVRPRRWSFDKRKGVRVDSSWFVGDPLITALRTHAPEEVRADCCDPTICFVLVGGIWIKAFHCRVQSIASASDREKLFARLWWPIARADARRRRDRIGRARYDRHQLAIAALPATQHLAPGSDPISPLEPTADTPRSTLSEATGPEASDVSTGTPATTEPGDEGLDFDSLEPFDEGEDF